MIGIEQWARNQAYFDARRNLLITLPQSYAGSRA